MTSFGAKAQVSFVVPPTEIDAATAPGFRQALLASDPRDLVVVDFSGVTHCGSVGIRVLLEANARHERAGGALTVRDPSPEIRRVFEITRTTCLLEGSV